LDCSEPKKALEVETRGPVTQRWIVDFKRATVFCLGYRLSKHKTTRYVRNLGVHSPLLPLATRMG